ncbi:hypothetical protein BJF79_31295 [Actinomadura sp. CNU-125]|uniref:hypothetical protein n=1 Tax=Actinomadura sp. CNU-125 TaxID=1904961 RepID=UPI000965AFF6|nr:hypothetical protein [Actinomadura sp. CNU-125]OLT36361.1 hypothetical protein BJF79_31295 [Actinomadura sp. CNU-125]
MNPADTPDQTSAPSDPLASSVPLFDPAQLPLRRWCAGSREDAVTGLVAFPDFHSHIPRALTAALTGGNIAGLAIGDVDGLKEHVEQANSTDPDCYGHLAGNRVMARLGAVTRSWFHQQPWEAGCAATFGGDEVIIAATLDDATAFHRAVTELADRLSNELPVSVSFALTFASVDHLPPHPHAGGWKHVFTDRLLAAVDRCLFTHKAVRRSSGGEGGTIAVTQLPMPAPTHLPGNRSTLLPLPTSNQTLHVLARPIDVGGRSMLALPCAGPDGLRGTRLRVTFPDGATRAVVAVSLHGQAAISHKTVNVERPGIQGRNRRGRDPQEMGIPLTLRPIRPRSPRGVPNDLAAALERADLDWSALPTHEQNQMLHLITESATDDIRAARITAAIDAVATRSRR